MTGIYFSGTGNTKHCIEKFITALSLNRNESTQHPTQVISIEESTRAIEALKNAHDMIIFAYPIYYSNLPKIVRDFINDRRKATAERTEFLFPSGRLTWTETLVLQYDPVLFRQAENS